MNDLRRISLAYLSKSLKLLKNQEQPKIQFKKI